MKSVDNDLIRQAVRESYAKIANESSDGCGCAPSCCGDEGVSSVENISLSLGYSAEELSSIPTDANMGLGCGNPQAIASLKEGEVVMDLGAGGGLDCFLAVKEVGTSGYVIGVDMTPDMITVARKNVESSGYKNVEFRLGEIEHIPAADNSVDVIISNCVINLSPDKQSVYDEAYRVLKAGGRLAIADVVTRGPLPDDLLDDPKLYSSCISGAEQVSEIKQKLNSAGFTNISITTKDDSSEFIKDWSDDMDMSNYVISANIQAVK
jgi:arsenite methyltransferase